MEAVCSSETSVDFQRATRRYISEHTTLPNHRYENLKSYEQNTFWRSWTQILKQEGNEIHLVLLIVHLTQSLICNCGLMK
jgi:hypothetical protein